MAAPLNLTPRKGPANGHPRRTGKFDVVIRNSGQNFNLANALGTCVAGRKYRVLVASGVLLGSSSAATPAFDTGMLPAGAVVELTVRGRIQGAGGKGGNGSAVNVGNNPNPGGAGGDAVKAQCPLSIINTGMIAGGGGGGGGGARGATINGSSGGGGGGGAGSAAGVQGSVNSGLQSCGGNGGQAGSLDSGGSGGSGCNWNGSDPSGAGGAGGGPGKPGSSGVSAGGGTGAAGGAAGKAVNKNGCVVTVLVAGSMLGAVT